MIGWKLLAEIKEVTEILQSHGWVSYRSIRSYFCLWDWASTECQRKKASIILGSIIQRVITMTGNGIFSYEAEAVFIPEVNFNSFFDTRRYRSYCGGNKTKEWISKRVFREIWRALFSWNTRFEIRPFILLPTIGVKESNAIVMEINGSC